MSADLQLLEEWIPEKMDPGTIFVPMICSSDTCSTEYRLDGETIIFRKAQ